MNVTLTEIIALLGVVAGGGGLWAYLTNKRKTSAEAVALSTKTAMDAILQSVEFLKARTKELGEENSSLRELMELQQARMEERHQTEVTALQEQKAYFQDELARAQVKFEQCRKDLELKIDELGRAHARIEDQMRRFPQFQDTWRRPNG